MDESSSGLATLFIRISRHYACYERSFRLMTLSAIFPSSLSAQEEDNQRFWLPVIPFLNYEWLFLGLSTIMAAKMKNVGCLVCDNPQKKSLRMPEKLIGSLF